MREWQNRNSKHHLKRQFSINVDNCIPKVSLIPEGNIDVTSPTTPAPTRKKKPKYTTNVQSGGGGLWYDQLMTTDAMGSMLPSNHHISKYSETFESALKIANASKMLQKLYNGKRKKRESKKNQTRDKFVGKWKIKNRTLNRQKDTPGRPNSRIFDTCSKLKKKLGNIKRSFSQYICRTSFVLNTTVDP